MTTAEMLASVKHALGIEGTYQDNTLTEYINEVMEFLVDSGIPPEMITAGLVSRGVSDLWSYGANNGKLSDYFMQRAAQLAFKAVSGNG
jgi:hypothetical protein